MSNTLVFYDLVVLILLVILSLGCSQKPTGLLEVKDGRVFEFTVLTEKGDYIEIEFPRDVVGIKTTFWLKKYHPAIVSMEENQK